MTVRHLPGLDPENWYVIDSNQGDEGQPPWRERKLSLHGPNTNASVAWYVLGKHGFGYGFQLGRNGSESDLGLDLYAGRLASVWLRLGTPWTKWAKVSKEQDPKGWYNARHTGIRLFPREDCFLSGQWEAYEHHWSSSDPWWRNWSITKTTILGRTRGDTTDGESGETVVPLPEGNYSATWQRTTYVTRYVRFPGTLLDRINGPRRHSTISLNIEGGIPVEGKGESSWDCGMDGVFGINGSTVEDAVANAVKAVLRDRKRYGGPHSLERPTTVSEAASR
jgi:hypothetical protein